MKQNQFKDWIFSSIGIIAVFVILVAVCVIMGALRVRVDLTQDNLYTLSAGTKAILAKLDTPVILRLYATEKDTSMPVPFKNYAKRVEDLLYEYEKAAHGKVQVERYDPEPDSDAEDSARLDGVQPRPIGLDQQIYLGLSASAVDQKTAIPFLALERETLLEYDITRAIAQVAAAKKPIVGIMSSLPVMGSDFKMNFPNIQAPQQQEPWTFINELKRDFELRSVPMDVTQIASEMNVLLVIHPKDITEKTQYAIDQFILRGGKLAAFLDPFSIFDSREPQQPGSLFIPKGSSLDMLLKAWGINSKKEPTLLDMSFRTPINMGGRPMESPAVLSLTREAVNQDDVLTAQLDKLLFPIAGVLSGDPTEGLKETVLIKSSKNCQVVESFKVALMGEQLAKEFSPTNQEQPLAIRLTGKFKTAFPDGKPKDSTVTEPQLKEAAEENAMILVADTDFLADEFSVQVQNFFGYRMVTPQNGNLNLVQNIVEQLAGDINLIAVRSRGTRSRPFTRVRSMEAEANARYQQKIVSLERDLTETQQRLNQLQQQKTAEQQFVLSTEQQEELKKFERKRAEVRKELKEVRRSLRKEVTSLENRIKWLNIAAMPLIVVFAGVGLAIVRKRKSQAK